MPINIKHNNHNSYQCNKVGIKLNSNLEDATAAIARFRISAAYPPTIKAKSDPKLQSGVSEMKLQSPVTVQVRPCSRVITLDC